MKLDTFEKQNKLKISSQSFCLDIESWGKYKNKVVLKWETVKFEKGSKNKVPDSPGIYSFFVKPGIAGFPENAYLMYIGKAGDESNNTLRKRFMQYIYGMATDKRPKLNWFLKTWGKKLYFCYAPITDKRFKLGKIEEDLNDALIPPFNENDFSTEVKKIVKVLR